MSVGHQIRRSAVNERELDEFLANSRIKRYLEMAKKIDHEHDIPYLAGYSKDGKTIFIDRHLPRKLKVAGHDVETEPFLMIHECLEKALISFFKMRYQEAHAFATLAEHRAVAKAGIRPPLWEGALKPYIKADEHEKLVKVPPDLDRTPYADSHDRKLLARLEAA